MAIEAEIAQASATLGEELDAAADLADNIANLIEKAQSIIGQIEDRATSFYNTANDQLGAFVTQIEKQGQIVETAGNNLGDGLGSFRAMVDQGQPQSETDCAATEAVFLAANEDANALSDRVGQARCANDALDLQNSAALGQAGKDIQAGGSALTGELGLFDGHVQSLEKQIEAFLVDVAERLTETNSAIADEIKKQLDGELGAVTKSFGTALALLADQQAQTAIAQIGSDAVNHVENTLRGMIDTAIAGLESALANALAKLMDADGRTDAENRLLDESMEWLKPMYVGFIQQVRQVDWIAGFVGHPL